MLRDFDVIEIEEIWAKMINGFNLEDKNWLKELYEMRSMWTTSSIRGGFFACIRTTSCSEAFNSHLGKFINSKIRLSEFVEQCQRYLSYFWHSEI